MSAFFRLPLLPEAIRLLWFPVPGPNVRLDIKGICPSDMVRAPTDKTMKTRIRLVVGADRYTEGTGRMAPAPIHTTCFSVDRPLEGTPNIRDIMGLGGPFPVQYRLRRAFLRANLTGSAKFRYAKINGLIRDKGQIGNHIV